MKTIITLDKKPGLFRPHATITVELEAWERDLLPTVDVNLDFTVSIAIQYHESESAALNNDGQDFSGCPDRPYVKYIEDAGIWFWVGFMPWKPGELTIEDYPELKELAQHIQDHVAKILAAAIGSAKIDHVEEELPPPEDYKQKVAACKFANMAKEDS
jgi:hypothetical protein